MATECIRSREKRLFDISENHFWDSASFRCGQIETRPGGFILPDNGSKGELPPSLRSRTIRLSINGTSLGYRSPASVFVGIGQIAGEDGDEIYQTRTFTQMSGAGMP